MRNDTLVTEVGQQYVAAHAAHYGSKDLREALTLYKALVAVHPDTKEAGYSRSQIQNIAKGVVSDQTLSDAHVDVAMAHLEHGDRPDVRPVPSSSRSARQAGPHRSLVLLLGLCLLPAMATAQADVAEVPGDAHAKRYGVGWECDWGYRTVAQSCEPVIVPAHAHLDGFGGRWDCNRGYGRVGDTCAAVEVPPHAFLDSSGHRWECERGYRRVAERCAEVVVPPHAFLNSRGDRWESERGFRRNGQSCVEFAVPRNAHIGYSENEWTCNPGYRQRGATCLPDER